MAANCGQTLPKQATGQVPRSRPAFARQASRACTRLLSVAWWSTLFSRYVAGLLLFTGTFGIDGAFAFFRDNVSVVHVLPHVALPEAAGTL